MAKFGFDVSEVEIDAPVSRDPVPPGDYVLRALEAEEKTTASGGTMIKVKFEVVEGEYAGRWIWNNFNTFNASEKAQQIGRQQLRAWAAACGKPDVDDTDKLVDKKFRASVAIQKGTGGYSDSNVIKVFLTEKKAAAAPASKPAAAPAEPPAGRKPAGVNPWD